MNFLLFFVAFLVTLEAFLVTPNQVRKYHWILISNSAIEDIFSIHLEFVTLLWYCHAYHIWLCLTSTFSLTSKIELYIMILKWYYMISYHVSYYLILRYEFDEKFKYFLLIARKQNVDMFMTKSKHFIIQGEIKDYP